MSCSAAAAIEPLEDRRLFAAGQLDQAFGVKGIAHPAVSLPDSLRFAEAAPGGKIVVVGTANQNQTIISRIKSDGTLDKSFGGGTGIVTHPLESGDFLPMGAAVDPRDGRIAVISYG